jgi:hypothetical protein
MNEDLDFNHEQKNSFGSVQKPSEGFGNVRNDSEAFGKIPNNAESFRTVPRASERKEYCTLTVREAARLFEAAGVARTERSIINWCQRNKLGVARLDNYFDPNERRYFISPQSVELAIQEEKAKAAKGGDSFEPVEIVQNASERKETIGKIASESGQERIRELERELFDLKIANRGKDYFIEELKNERAGFTSERKDYVTQLMVFNRKVGELETRLLQLNGPGEMEGQQTGEGD